MKISPGDIRQRLLPILLAQAVGLVCGLAGVRLTSRFVAPEDYGIYGVCTSLAAVGTGVVYAGLIKFVSRHWQTAEDRAGLMREVIAAAVRKTPWLVAAIAAGLYLIPGAPLWSGGTLLLASALLLGVAQFAQSALQAAREHWRDLGVSAGGSVTRSFAPPLLYAATGGGPTALLAGFFLHAVAIALLGTAQMRRWFGGIRAPRARQLTAVYDGPQFVALALAGWVLVGLNRWIAAWFFGADVAGFYTLAAGLGSFLPSVLGLSLLQYVQPTWFAQTPADLAGRRKLLREVDRVALGFTLLAVAVAAALHAAMPVLIGPLVNERYAAAARFVLAAGCSTTAATIGLFYHAMLLAAHREQACGITDLSGAAVLATAAVVSARAGIGPFTLWLVISPVVPWLVNRTFARRALLAAS